MTSAEDESRNVAKIGIGILVSTHVWYSTYNGVSAPCLVSTGGLWAALPTALPQPLDYATRQTIILSTVCPSQKGQGDKFQLAGPELQPNRACHG